MWRGPMLHKALEQFLSDVHWGELDTLLVDMPPGTGDVAMSLGQLLPRAEALVVTTPQPAAQQVAVRAAQMAQKTGMRILGASRTCRTSPAPVRSSSAREAARRSPTRSASRCSRASRSTRSCARLRTRAVPSPRSRPTPKRPPRRCARRVGRGVACRLDPQAAHRSRVARRVPGGRLLRSRPDAHLAVELARSRRDVPQARSDRPAAGAKARSPSSSSRASAPASPASGRRPRARCRS